MFILRIYSYLKIIISLHRKKLWMHANRPHFLRENIKKFWAKEMWPPCSPDRNPLDFSVWAYLEKTVCLKNHTGIESLKKDSER